MSESVPRGLAGVEADVTAISSIDGEKGELRYRGFRIEDLVAKAKFADVVGLVVNGELAPVPLVERTLPEPVSDLLRVLPASTHPMRLLQIVMPLLGEDLFEIAPRVPTVVAAWSRLRDRQEPIVPDPSLPIHADFLRMLRGLSPDPADVATLDATQILQMEHGFNASTFTARTIASTRAPLPAALAGAVGALSGPLHGGADEAAYRMALEIGSPGRAAAYVDEKLARGERIMGLGHREYRVVDPRARVLLPMALALAERNGLETVATLSAVDDHASRRFEERGKRIRANVEFYKGAVFAALGISPDFFTALFVMARVYGWGAHVLELSKDNVLYRPAARYIGAAPRELS
jgi:citrate synthase